MIAGSNRRRSLLMAIPVLAVLVFLVGVAVPLITSPTRAAAAAAPGPGQIITVSAPSASSTTAVLEGWQRNAKGGYGRVFGFPAFVGSAGVGVAAEGISRTPAGIFTLTQAFGLMPNPGSGVPYRQVDNNDWWVGDSNSALYNSPQRCAPGSCPFAEGPSERLRAIGQPYNHALVIDYNRRPAAPRAGSAFFLHVSNGRPTAGCVSVTQPALQQILRWLRPSAHPVISIGVGTAAKAPYDPAYPNRAAHNPFGGLDLVQQSTAGAVRVYGWAADPDDRHLGLQIVITSDGRNVGTIRTGASRPDVGRIRSVGILQGYDGVIRTGAGSHTVCAIAVNWAVGTTNPRLGCRTVTVR